MRRTRNTLPLKTALGGSRDGGAKPSGVRGATPSRPNAGTLGQSSQVPPLDVAAILADPGFIATRDAIASLTPAQQVELSCRVLTAGLRLLRSRGFLPLAKSRGGR